MTWQDVGNFISGVAPTVGSFLAGPAGEKIGELVSSALGVQNKPDQVLDALKNNPDALIKIKQIEADRQIELTRIALGVMGEETKGIEAVNETMRAEIASSDKEAWYQKAWRPANGFAVAAGSFLSIVFVCYIFYRAIMTKDAASLPQVISMVPQLAFAIASILAIPGAAVGISAWHRGVTKRIEAGEGQQ